MSGPLHLPLSTPVTALPPPPAPLPLEELLKQAATGDHGALAELYDATASRAFGLALRVTRDRPLAEDVVQEAYSDIWRSAASFDPKHGSGIAWVLAIVHGKAVARIRSTSTRWDDEEDTPVARAAAHAPATPEGESPAGQKVRSALSQVPTAQRRAVELAYFGGYTHSAIARMAGMPADTATSRIREGLIELRRRLPSAS